MALIRRPTTTTPARIPDLDWDPFSGMRDLMNWDPFRTMAPRLWRSMGETAGTYMPGFDIRETKDTYVVTADVPGFKEADLAVQVSGNRITLSGERKAEKVEDTDTWYLCERSQGSFSRTFTLPDDADTENAQAELREGVLNLRVPRSGEAKPKSIPVQRTGGATPKA